MINANFSTVETQSIRAAIANTAKRLKDCTQHSHQRTWRMALAPLDPSVVLPTQDWRHWAIAPCNETNYITWSRGQRPLWLCQAITVPKTVPKPSDGFPLEGLSLRLGLTWWAEAVAVYVNGQLVQEGDLFDYFARIPLSDRVTPGDTFVVAIHMLSPGHDEGALVRSEAIYESTQPTHPEPGFVADELTVLQTYAETLAPEKLTDIGAAIAPLDWSTVSDQGRFQQELAALRQRLHPLSRWIKQRQITCVGHAHLDLAWLWPVEDTWRAAERTFRSVLSLQESFPELTYTHSSPALFNWLETHQPDLFQTVCSAVKQGAWSIDAGLWVEPELNTIGGESLARQILYGQRYSRSRFGQESAIAWLPDCFGFSWQLPQLLKLGGIDYFATQKLRWNEATTFPHSLFWWQGLDGTQLLSLTLPPIGTDIDPVQMATHSTEWEAKTGFTEMLWLPGMGDHGGGPTRDMLEKARRWQNSPFFPQLTFTSPVTHLTNLSKALSSNPPPLLPRSLPTRSSPPTSSSPDSLPIWNDELYLELHRGCYTVHADQKWYNRRCEDTLREAELFASLAHMQGNFDYPKTTLENAWKRVLFNQFHDILPGTAIPDVFETTNPNWQAAYDTANIIRLEALNAIVRHLLLPDPPHSDAIPLFVFNSLNWEHTALVEIALSTLDATSETWSIFDPQSEHYLVAQTTYYSNQSDLPPGQSSGPTKRTCHLLFQATVPPVGYRLYWLIPNLNGEFESRPSTIGRWPSATEPWPSDVQLENDRVRAVISSSTGDLIALWDKQTQQNVLRSPANQLQAFQDCGQYWDAWDIAPNYQDHPLPAAKLVSIDWLETGPLRQRLRVIRHIADSIIQQDYVLDQPLPYLKVETVADWQATQVVLKTAFPVGFETDHATYEIPFGAIARPTQPATPHEQAKWEVPAYRWADLNNGAIGLSILTDYKHGFDAKPDQLRLTLLKAPLWPDPQADRGRHRFTYALYPHAGDWQTGQTPQWAISLNTHLQYRLKDPSQPWEKAVLRLTKSQTLAPLQKSFLEWDMDGVHLAALKLAEDSPDHYVLRVWELYGREALVDTKDATVERTNLLETAIALDQPNHLAPWQIATFKGPNFINEL